MNPLRRRMLYWRHNWGPYVIVSGSYSMFTLSLFGRHCGPRLRPMAFFFSGRAIISSARIDSRVYDFAPKLALGRAKGYRGAQVTPPHPSGSQPQTQRVTNIPQTNYLNAPVITLAPLAPVLAAIVASAGAVRLLPT